MRNAKADITDFARKSFLSFGVNASVVTPLNLTN